MRKLPGIPPRVREVGERIRLVLRAGLAIKESVLDFGAAVRIATGRKWPPYKYGSLSEALAGDGTQIDEVAPRSAPLPTDTDAAALRAEFDAEFERKQARADEARAMGYAGAECPKGHFETTYGPNNAIICSTCQAEGTHMA